MWWIPALSVGPLDGGFIGYKVGKTTDSPSAGLLAGIGASYATSMVTIGGVLRAGWAGSNFIRMGTATTSIGLGAAAAAAGYGYALGASIGTGVSLALFGKEGAEDAVRLYTSPVTGEVTLGEWAETVASIPTLISERNAARKSVGTAPAHNAAGLPEGTTEWEVLNPGSPFNPFTGEPNRAYIGG